MNTDRYCMFSRDTSYRFYQFGRAETQIKQLSGQEYLNFRTEGSDEGRVIEEFGIVYNDGTNAIKPGGLTPIYHLIDDIEAEKISKAKSF